MVLEALDNTRMKLTAYTIFWLLYCYFFIGYSSHFYGWDAYFHLTTSKKMALNGGVLETFPWVTDSVWNTMYFDKEWFFHWVNMVFLPFGDFESGKITILFFNMFVPAGMYYLLKSLHVRNVWFWMLLFPLMAYASFILRMTALRPHIVSVPIFLFSLGMIIKQKKIPFFFITILYTLSYTGSWQIFFIAGLWDVLRFFFLPSGKLRKHRKLFFPMFMVAFLGILVGTLIHPSFPHNIKGLWYQNCFKHSCKWKFYP